MDKLAIAAGMEPEILQEFISILEIFVIGKKSSRVIPEKELELRFREDKLVSVNN